MPKKSARRLNNEAIEEHKSGATKRVFHEKDLVSVSAKTQAQKDLFHAWNNKEHLVLSGSAGAGKSFLALYAALREVLNPETEQDKVVIVRSATPVLSVGHLPGDLTEKTEVYEMPYKGVCNELFPYAKSYDNLKKNGYLDFMVTSYVRGITLNNCIVVLDEAASATFHEIDSVVTRLGQNSRLIVCGDVRQADIGRKEGFSDFMKIAEQMDEFGIVNFMPEDIVRSGMVRSYLIKREKMGL